MATDDRLQQQSHQPRRCSHRPWVASVRAGTSTDRATPLSPWPSCSSDREAAATSSTGRRRWIQGNQERRHLIDSRTGRPAAGGLQSVTIVADDLQAHRRNQSCARRNDIPVPGHEAA
ncbi:MAG: FAD:protein FMN transferase [Actinomycetia bacterium]|nr:FAD:protein FMN transferase [Actinomycetes bacterium]